MWRFFANFCRERAVQELRRHGLPSPGLSRLSRPLSPTAYPRTGSPGHVSFLDDGRWRHWFYLSCAKNDWLHFEWHQVVYYICITDSSDFMVRWFLYCCFVDVFLHLPRFCTRPSTRLSTLLMCLNFFLLTFKCLEVQILLSSTVIFYTNQTWAYRGVVIPD